jgi:hypothetical protein
MSRILPLIAWALPMGSAVAPADRAASTAPGAAEWQRRCVSIAIARDGPSIKMEGIPGHRRLKT